MRSIISVLMSAVLLSLYSCSRTTGWSACTEHGDVSGSATIRTEESLSALLVSVKAGEIKRDVSLIGKLDLGANPKLDPAKLLIGNTFVHFGHDLDKDKYDKQTILVEADIRNWQGEEAQISGHTIVNVKHVEIMK